MLSGMTIRTRLLVVAVIPAAVLALTVVLLRGSAPAGAGLIATGLALAGVAATVVVALVVARSITAPLHRLGEAAERASHLQTMVEALRRSSGNDRALALAPVGLPAGGEIGTMAAAFDDFQGAAARLAVGQADLLNKTVAEKGTIEVFVNLARRMQGLVDHQIEFLDGLEAEEQDPDTLENLFRLDQMATRVRRNAESLLTLARAAPGRSGERPLAMSDVIRAGMAAVEDIGRVDLMVDDNAAMLGNAAADAAHLLAELLENATRWSPPDTRVEVTGTRAAGGYAVTIEDTGTGMAADALAEANHILTGPPLAEASVARSLGLVVAGRLARRLGIVVRLVSASTGGIVAKVLVPPSLMVAADEPRGPDLAAGPAQTLPFALVRQQKRARISSQRANGPSGVAGSAPAEVTIMQLHESRWMDEPVPEQESWWIDTEPATDAPVEPEWPADVTDWPSDVDQRPSADPHWTPSEPEWSGPAQVEWASADPQWPALSTDDEPATEEPEWVGAPGWAAAQDTEPELPAPASEPEWLATTPVAGAAHVMGEPAAAPTVEWPAAAAQFLPAEDEVAAVEPVAPPPPVQVAPSAEPEPVAPPPPEPDMSGLPSPMVRPARFAASSPKSLAGSAAVRAVVPADAKEDEYRRHLERATAAGLVRRVPKASLPNDTGGGAKRAPRTGVDQPVAERLPDEVRSLLASYRSGVQRGRADGPDADQRTTTPQEQP